MFSALYQTVKTAGGVSYPLCVFGVFAAEFFLLKSNSNSDHQNWINTGNTIYWKIEMSRVVI